MIHPNTTMQSELSFLICGLEHSGTTMASDLFREHPEVDSGFECGVLLCDNPSDFLTLTPFRNHMAVGWGINEEDLTYACQAVNFDGFYERLFERSSIIQTKKPKFVFDKITKLFEQGLISSRDLTTELISILRSKRDEIVFKMRLTSKDEFEVLSKRVENLEKKIEKLKFYQKKKTKKVKRS